MKNKKNPYLFASLFLSIVLVQGCKDVDIPETICFAGADGEIALRLYPQHHLEPIPNLPAYPDTAFIKFNASEFPGEEPHLYDLILIGEAGTDFVVAENMKCGNYFIFMTGFDESISQRVKGGIPIFVDRRTVLQDFVIPVTED